MALAAIEFQNPASNVVQEVSIVGDGNDRAVVILQRSLQPMDRIRIQVVGRFVQQQQIRFFQQQLAECDTTFFSTRKLSSRRRLGLAGS